MYDVFRIVNWLRVRNNTDLRTDLNVEKLVQMKAMKLLYYIQAASLVVTNKRMFDNDIVAWKYGPVVEEVHRKYAGCRGIIGQISKQDVEDYKEPESDDEAAVTLNSTYDTYGHSSAYNLVRQTHSEGPWQGTTRNQVISDKKMKDFYENVFRVVNN